MPKGPNTSTTRRKARLARIFAMDYVVARPCQRCCSKNLRCVLSLEGNCAECISSSLLCSLFPSKEEFTAVAKQKQELRREIREVERRQLNLEEQLDSVVDKEKALFDRKKDSLVELEQLEAIHRASALVSSTSHASTTSTVVASPLLPSFLTDLGWF